jgi:hypothetical protein
MKFQPLFDNIVVELEEEDTLLRGSEPVFTENGKVVAIGDDVKVVQEGDILGLFKFGVKKIQRNGIKVNTVRELPAFILGKWSNE